MISSFFQSLLMSMVELAVAVDVLGTLPIYMGWVENTPEDKKRALVRNCMITAFLVGMVFVFLGKMVFKTISITMGDFEIAGGLVLILIGVLDLTGEEKKLRKPSESIGVVPLGVPLVVGPAVISILLLQTDRYGISITLLSFLINLLVVGLAFRFSNLLMIYLRRDAMKAVSKVMMLLLIGIGVKMIPPGHLRILAAQDSLVFPP